MRSENLNSDRTHKNKLLFHLLFFRKIFLNPDKILITLARKIIASPRNQIEMSI
jgi:hypothetical protein